MLTPECVASASNVLAVPELGVWYIPFALARVSSVCAQLLEAGRLMDGIVSPAATNRGSNLSVADLRHPSDH